MRRLAKALTAFLLRLFARCLPVARGRVRLLSLGNSGSNTLVLSLRPPPGSAGKLDLCLLSPYRPRGLLRSLRWAADLGRAEVVVSTHGYRKLNPRQKNLELWHGFPLKGMNRMDPTELRAGTAKESLEGADLVASYSSLYSSLMNACMGLDAGRYAVTGMPRNDLLWAQDGETVLDALLGAPTAGRRVVFYMPTFRRALGGRVDGDKSSLNLFGFPEFDPARFSAFLASRRIRLVAKLHPFEERVFFAEGGGGAPEGVELLTDRALKAAGVELYGILSRADALVTDYSSVYFDLLLRDIPLVFCPVDLDSYKKSRGFLMEPYEFWAPGPKAREQAAFEAALGRALEEPSWYSAERRSVRDIVHAWQDGDSSRRVWEAILGLMRQTKAQAE